MGEPTGPLTLHGWREEVRQEEEAAREGSYHGRLVGDFKIIQAQ